MAGVRRAATLRAPVGMLAPYERFFQFVLWLVFSCNFSWLIYAWLSVGLPVQSIACTDHLRKDLLCIKRDVKTKNSLTTVGSRAFPVAAAKIWNALPDSLVSMTSLQTFRRHLKTFLFQRSFRQHCTACSSFTLLRPL